MTYRTINKDLKLRYVNLRLRESRGIGSYTLPEYNNPKREPSASQCSSNIGT